MDSKGNYYIKDLDYMICISNEGKFLWEMNNRLLGISRSYAAVAVEDAVYMSYQKNDVTYIGKVNPADVSLKEEYSFTEIPGSDPIMVMGQGTDRNHLSVYIGWKVSLEEEYSQTTQWCIIADEFAVCGGHSRIKTDL